MRQDEYKALVRAKNKQIWEALRDLQALQSEWNALDYLNTLVTEPTEPTAAEFGAVVFGAADALEATLAGGVATNMAKLL